MSGATRRGECLVRRQPHADSIVRQAEDWLRKHFREPQVVAAVVAECGVPERSLKRRFKTATGATVIGYVQNPRIEEAKRPLETSDSSSDDIAPIVGYDNPRSSGESSSASLVLPQDSMRK